MATREHAQTGIDGLTGTLRREQGTIALQQTLDRAGPVGRLILAFVDVDGLKKVNDEQGHASGDQLLRDVGEELTTCLGADDVVVRYGGDEFLCALPGADSKIARQRFKHLAVNLTRRNPRASVTVGVATLENHDTLAQLTSRADADLYARRRRARDEPGPLAGPRAA